jgi:hypothetical protein
LGGPARTLLDPATWAAGLASTFERPALCGMAGLALARVGGSLGRKPADDRLGPVGAALILALS